MEQNDTPSLNKKFILLDISLFILGLLDPDKILNTNPNNDVILQIPSALITMILSAKAEFQKSEPRQKPVLLRFVEMYTRKIYQDKTEIEIEKISHGIVSDILFKHFNFIEGSENSYDNNLSKNTEQENKKSAFKPIRRYDPIVSTSDDDIHSLRQSYISIFGCDGHPLIDLYFLQVYHREFDGFDKKFEQNARGQMLCAGSDTVSVIKKWNKWSAVSYENKNHPEIKKYQTVMGGQLFNNESQVEYIFARERTKLINLALNYLKNNWLEIVISVGVDVALVVASTGTAGLSDVVLAVVGLTSTELIFHGSSNILHPTEITPPASNNNLNGVISISLGLFFILCVALVFRPKITLQPTKFFEIAVSQPTPTIAMVVTEKIMLQTPGVESLVVFAVTPTVAQDNVFTSQNAGSCIYAIQIGDTIQSVATRFKVSEDSLKLRNPLVNNGVFAVRQQIRIDSSCCLPIENQGYSYYVVQGETLYNLWC